MLSFWGAVYSKNTWKISGNYRNWPKNFIKASGPAHRCIAVPSGKINENTAKNPSMGPSVSFHWNTEAKTIIFSGHRSFTVLSGEINGIYYIEETPRKRKIPPDFSYTIVH
jgi:hypothetical protein